MRVCMLFVLLCTSPVMAQDLVIRGGHYFDSEARQFRSNEQIVVHDGLIESIGSDDEQPKDISVLELENDQYILPGLIDLHAHYNVRLFSKRREEFEVMPVVYLANGATVTFTAGEFDPEGMQALRQRIENGQQLGPRILNSGPYFGRARPGWPRDITEEQIRREVQQWAPKVGGFKAKQIRPEHLRVLIDEAHRHGKTVTAHLDSGYRNSVNPVDAIAMGIDRIEHFLGGEVLSRERSAYATLSNIESDHPALQAATRFYIDAGVYFDATITAYGYIGNRGDEYEHWADESAFFTDYVLEKIADREHKPMEVFERIYQLKQTTIDDYFESGGMITLGTDHVSDGSYLPGFGIHRELDAFVRSGIPEADALLIATLNGAKAMGIADRHGSIEVGKAGDFYVIEGDPLENIRHTRNGRFVVRGGAVHATDQLFESVYGKLGPNNESEQSAW